ncbi:MAG: hypothetical protein IJP78_03820 [Clostridia bacterium]|nr:hypothetical protein [Clostridia bacterium]
MVCALAFGILAGVMMAFPGEAAAAAGEGLSLWARAVAPVLGPFLVCMLMVSSRAGGGIGLKTVLGWLCGSPGGARLMQGSGLTGRSALRAAAMTGTMSPMFFLGTVSGWLGDARAGRLILLCHIAGAALLGLCMPKGEKAAPVPAAPVALSQALRDSALALLTVALCMMLGCAAARMAACAFPRLPGWAAAGLQCGLEVTGGVKALIGLGLPHTSALVCGACSFGGLSILLQNAAFWQESGVGVGKLLLLRMVHGIISAALCFVICRL